MQRRVIQGCATSVSSCPWERWKWAQTTGAAVCGRRRVGTRRSWSRRSRSTVLFWMVAADGWKEQTVGCVQSIVVRLAPGQGALRTRPTTQSATLAARPTQHAHRAQRWAGGERVEPSRPRGRAVAVSHTVFPKLSFPRYRGLARDEHGNKAGNPAEGWDDGDILSLIPVLLLPVSVPHPGRLAQPRGSGRRRGQNVTAAIQP